MSLSRVDASFWNGKRVFLTGHTGFKGSWLSVWLSSMGALVTGFSRDPNTTPAMFDVLDVSHQIESSVIGDISNFDTLTRAMRDARPSIVIHMAAQPLVRYSYANPIETYTTNVLGTVHVLEAVRLVDNIRAVLVVTTDKCYENDETGNKFTETDPLGGYDPYSSSKACAELVTAAFRQSYFSGSPPGALTAVASARAGNVIGGGDWSSDRLIPDAIRAFTHGRTAAIRNPRAVRPWQHVLEPLSGYLLLTQHLYNNGQQFAGGWNFGPRDIDARSVQVVLDLLIESWGGEAAWEHVGSEPLHEAHYLKLDISKANTLLNWKPRWSLEKAIARVVEWHQALNRGDDMLLVCLDQIKEYEQGSVV
jgi:CDP-glucose 4,6-dehydratase